MRRGHKGDAGVFLFEYPWMRVGFKRVVGILGDILGGPGAEKEDAGFFIICGG